MVGYFSANAQAVAWVAVLKTPASVSGARTTSRASKRASKRWFSRKSDPHPFRAAEANSLGTRASARWLAAGSGTAPAKMKCD